MNKRYIVCGNRPWSRKIYDHQIRTFPGQWKFFSDSESLDSFDTARYNPEKIFFLHWSWPVPEKLWKHFTCVGFHMTDLPFGRGGSPLQNLISRGINKTKLSAYIMGQELDAGPILLKRALKLNGSAEDIYHRTSELSAKMIFDCIQKEFKPKAQGGIATFFERRKPAQSELPSKKTLGQLYDHIRMLDAPGYPRAFLEANGYRLEFSKADQKAISNGALTAKVKITALGGEL